MPADDASHDERRARRRFSLDADAIVTTYLTLVMHADRRERSVSLAAEHA